MTRTTKLINKVLDDNRYDDIYELSMILSGDHHTNPKCDLCIITLFIYKQMRRKNGEILYDHSIIYWDKTIKEKYLNIIDDITFLIIIKMGSCMDCQNLIDNRIQIIRGK